MMETASDRKQVYTYFGKKVRESLSCLSDNESNLATNKTLGYEILRVKLNMVGLCTARFWIDSRC